MNNIFGGSVSNQLYLVYGLIGVVVVLIIIIIIMDSKEKKKLHKNLFDNKTLKKNLKHLEETGELPIVEAKPKKDFKFVKPAKKVKEIDAIEEMGSGNITIVHETDEEVGLVPEVEEKMPVEEDTVDDATSIDITPVVPPVKPKEEVKEEIKEEIKEVKEEVKEVIPPKEEEPLPVPDVRVINKVNYVESKMTVPEIVNIPEDEKVSSFTKTTKDVDKNKEQLLDRVLDAGLGIFNSKEDKENQRKLEKKEELKELAEISGIDYVEDEPLEKTNAQIEVEKITEDLENGDSDLVESTQFEKDQEKNAILSMNELMEKKDALMEENESKQYLDEKDSPITIKELKDKVESDKYKATPNDDIELLV